MVIESPYPNVEIPEISLVEYVTQRIGTFEDDVAIIDNTRGNSITFRQAKDQIKNCANALYLQGVRKGDVVAICSSNRVEYPIVMLAVASCGAAVTTCNPFYHEGEIIQQFKMSKPRLVFCDAEEFQKLATVAKELSGVTHVYTFGEAPGSISYNTLIKSGIGKDFPKPSINPKEDICILPYSSGTTGLPKGVMLTHRNLVSQMLLTRMTLFMTRSSCFYMAVPMFHTLGFSISTYCLSQGAKTVIDARFDAERMFQAIQKHKVTHFSAVPPIMILLSQTNLVEKYDTSSLKRMLCGAAPIAPQLKEIIAERYKVAVSPSYGLTELVPICSTDPLINKPNATGTICPNTIVKIIDIDSGDELGPGEDGEILAKGPQMMKGYFGNPGATAQTIDKDGWLHTGDIGNYDKDGMLYVTDRLKELIKYKGFQVAPAELEAALLNHPEVMDAAVIGIPDPLAGEVPKAFVVKKDPLLTENDVKRFIEGELANYKHLRGGVQFIDVIPKSPSGKILRKVLRELPGAKSRL